MSALGEKLKELRSDASLTQKEVAEYLGLNRSTYAFYESGKAVPRITLLNMLCKLYSVPMDVFVQCMLTDGT